MRTLTAKPPSKSSLKQKPTPANPAFDGYWQNQSMLSSNDILVQRKPSCACEGGCPSCRTKEKDDEEDQPIQAKLKTSQPQDILVQRKPSCACKQNCTSPKTEEEKDKEEDQPIQAKLKNGQPEDILVQRACSCGGSCPSSTPKDDKDEEEEKPVQAKLKISQPQDKYEQEADQISEQIMAKAPKQGLPASRNINHMIQRACKCGSGTPPSAKQQSSGIIPGMGEPLPETVQELMESSFQSDFNQVRVHHDSAARNSAEHMQAKAYTHSNHIIFGQGQYQPHSVMGQKLIAHELTHVLQQQRSCLGNPGLVSNAEVQVQRTVGDGHDLQSPRFSGNSRLEAAYDDESYVQMGARGDHVIILQQALVDAGHPLPKYGVDGIFGSETRGAVISYQTERGLKIDGIVGPETMGDLDRFYIENPPQTKIPPGLTDICSLITAGQQPLPNENGLIFVSDLGQELEQAAEKMPQWNAFGGEDVIECQDADNKKSCGDLCGCPLPASNYKATMNDLAQVMPHATAWHEENPQPGKERRQLICPPPNTPVKVLRIFPPIGSQGVTFVEVFFCDGPVADKNGKMVYKAYIQEQFLQNGKPLEITGPNEINRPANITLTAGAAHPGTKAHWSIEHRNDANGRAEIVGADNTSSVEIKGKELSSLRGDITVRLTACGNEVLHRLTVREPFVPNLPTPAIPTTPPGIVIPPGSPSGYCQPMPNLRDAESMRQTAISDVQDFINVFHNNDRDTLDLYMTYLNTPKTGLKGVLPPRRKYTDETTRFVQSFMKDPETTRERERIRDLIVARVKRDRKLIPPVGETTFWMPFRTVLADNEIMDLPMEFKEPRQRIPGFVAGGYDKNASDAGDDVRNADGQFSVTNLNGTSLHIWMKFIFDVFDAVDFCPGAHGGFPATLLTIRLSRCEATPNLPTYDTPFEVKFNLNDDVIT